MANFNIVIDTQAFKPFDISPALNILRDYRDAYYKYDEQLNKIAEENGQYVLPDTPEYKKYKDIMDAYNKDLYNVVSDFSRGMNIRNAQAVRDIQKRYYSEMAPIKRMIESYNKYNDKVTALGPDAIIGNARTIDDFYGGINPTIDYRSAKQVEEDSIKYFSGLNNALTQDPDFKHFLGTQYWQLTQKGGLDGSTALKAALVEYNNRTNGAHSAQIQDLLGHMQNVMDTQGVEGFSEEAKERIWNKIASGMVTSVTAPKYSNLEDRNFISDVQQANIDQSKAYADYYKESKKDLMENREFKQMSERLKLGYVPEIDANGEVVRDENNNIKYKRDLKKAKELLELSGTKSDTNKETKEDVMHPPKQHIRMSYNGKDYAIKRDNGYFGGVSIYEYTEDYGWIQPDLTDQEFNAIKQKFNNRMRMYGAPEKDVKEEPDIEENTNDNEEKKGGSPYDKATKPKKSRIVE